MSDSIPYVVSVEDMMRACDERVHAQNETLVVAVSFPTPTALFSFGTNIPGAMKQTSLIWSSFLFGKERLTAFLHHEDYALLRTRELRRVSGDSWFCLIDAPPGFVKRLAVALEDNEPLARFFDINVLSCEEQKLSREDFSLPLRRCLLCEEAVVVCAKSHAHSVGALFSRCDSLLREVFPLPASSFPALKNHVAFSLLDEAYTAPKPSFVDRIDSGAHADVKFEDFILSIVAITPFLREMAVTAHQSCFTLPDAARETDAALLSRLWEIEKRAENEMYAATDGVNTHKGVALTLGFLSAGAGLLYTESGKFSVETILDEVQNLVGDTLRQEFVDLKAEEVEKVHGEAVLHRDDTGGVRNAAAKGFPVLRSAVLPLFRQYEAEERLVEAGVLNVFLHLILHVSGINVLYRGGKGALLTLRADCRNILSHGGAFTPEGIDLFYELKETCKQWNVSPGGAVDLLSAALSLHRLEKTLCRQLLPSMLFYVNLMARG